MNIVGDGFATSLPQGVPVPTINFDDGKVQVFTGCNTGTGEGGGRGDLGHLRADCDDRKGL